MTKRFLIAEDDEDDLALYKDAILNAALSIEVTSVVYCEGIFKSIAVEPLPHLVIVDGSLPGKSLLECITEIRTHEKLHSHPLVVLSGSAYAPVKVACYAAGINLYVEKPNSIVGMEELFKRFYHIDWVSFPSITSENFYSLDLF